MLIPRDPSDSRAMTTPLLRRLREALGLSMGDAARAHGWSVPAWCARELREDAPIDRETIETLVAAAKRKRRHEEDRP